MRYLLFVATDTEPDSDLTAMPPTEGWVRSNDARGTRILGHRLRPIEDATTIRVRNGELLITDGPFTESKEWVAGFDILECGSLDEAIEIAASHPMARQGRLEIRPFWPEEF
jgi:hypothetical protein